MNHLNKEEQVKRNNIQLKIIKQKKSIFMVKPILNKFLKCFSILEGDCHSADLMHCLALDQYVDEIEKREHSVLLGSF